MKILQNTKSQVLLVGIMIAVLAFVTVVSIIPPLKDSVIIARDPAHLDCSNTTISTGQQSTCIVTDYYLFAFVMAGLGAGLSYITGRAFVNRLQ